MKKSIKETLNWFICMMGFIFGPLCIMGGLFANSIILLTIGVGVLGVGIIVYMKNKAQFGRIIDPTAG